MQFFNLYIEEGKVAWLASQRGPVCQATPQQKETECPPQSHQKGGLSSQRELEQFWEDFPGFLRGRHPMCPFNAVDVTPKRAGRKKSV
jgi:hypothetical protein